MQVTREDLAVLYNPRTGNYRRVIRYRKGSRVKAEVDGHYLGDFPEEVEGARAVVRYMKHRYGSRWKDVLRSRNSHVASHSIRKGSKLRGRGEYSWVAEVSVMGTTVVVTGTLVPAPGWAGDGWASRKEAGAACKAFKARWGFSDSQGRPSLLRVAPRPAASVA